MCGIVGLLVKTPSMRDQLGEMMLPMLVGMSERGPESAGLAVFTAPVAEDRRKFSVYAGAVAPQWDEFALAAGRDLGEGTKVSVQANHAVVETSAAASRVKAWLKSHYPHHDLLSVGKSIA